MAFMLAGLVAATVFAGLDLVRDFPEQARGFSVMVVAWVAIWQAEARLLKRRGRTDESGDLGEPAAC